MLVKFLLIASTTVCTLEQIPEMGACRRCCTTGAVEACKFVRKCEIPSEEAKPVTPPSEPPKPKARKE